MSLKVFTRCSLLSTHCYNCRMIQPKPYRLSVEEYEHLAQMWHEDERVELLDGEIYAMAPISDDHVGALLILQRRLEMFRERAILSVQNPLRLTESEPQPDLVLLELPLERYTKRLPQAEDVLLLVEVSKSTLEYDRTKKLPVYARATIPEVWIRNLIDNQLEVYRNPQGERYTSLSTYAEGQEVAPLAFSGKPVQWWV